MKKFLLLLVIAVNLNGFAQNQKKIDKIVKEGKMLYRYEMASWYGTDIFLSRYKDRNNIGGYFSYVVKDSTRCVFFSRSEQPKIIGSITFGSKFIEEKASTIIKERDFTPHEQELYTIREEALKEISRNDIFVMYENTNFNIIPFIYEGKKKVYVLTGTTKTGVVFFGNDYLIIFNKQNKVKSAKKLHQNIIPIQYHLHDSNEKEIIHTHLKKTGDYFTVTDICTTMLYEKITGWERHIVASKKYYNSWDCKTNTMTVISMKVIKKINMHQKELKKMRQKNKEE